jgi:hypothetical protein
MSRVTFLVSFPRDTSHLAIRNFKATKPGSCLVRTSKSVVICRHKAMMTLLDIDDAKRFFSRITRSTNTTINGCAASM